METRSQDVEKRAAEADERDVQRAEAAPGTTTKKELDQLQETRMLMAKTDARLKEMMQAIMAISIQNQERTGWEIPILEGIGVEDGGREMNELGKSTRFEFPKFDGEGFDGWVMRAEYFFEVAGIADAERVRIATLHLEGKALK